ncbi:hypothetical protein CLAFUW4_10534 [Fulvia fulva]|uniref:Uncharacterized protein n=1 Tax=Passalora fulva TaxID=5499 RepID=A0A9Q8LEW5_PASFU|nr:uncharacterized protein CLAFUR5_05148 [Fulvia fulva]KAK4615848.1 hypothetical protein CLAFUR4_10539 [Fulvia fulva]KAK4616629.1 hypothetical protein CLAFUR0_10542 [Fulvia fulva]UJO16136.1 hypothetical protein CLAFUR5_05148 [Fulvia fulva]WPV19692.1 hypothetical protein CLAFUW4_10534 [Fulvia fulva]WPV34454.1 hypothetical protein CLAFUW7_10536 [Fulvia fulva]
MFKSVNYTAPQCENKELPAAPNNTAQVIQYLQQSQLGLSVVSRDLWENSKDLKTDLCNSFRPYRVVAYYSKKGYFENMTDIYPDAKQNCPNVKGSSTTNLDINTLPQVVLSGSDEPKTPREDLPPPPFSPQSLSALVQ